MIVLKHQRYVADLEEIEAALAKTRDYALIFEPPEEPQKDTEAKRASMLETDLQR